jgi:hypothetical protein
MNGLESTWLRLSQDAEQRGPGIYLRRILPDQPRDVFLCIRSPEDHRSVVLGLNHWNDQIAEGAFESAGISVLASSADLIPQGHESSLEIRLNDAQYQTVFDTLIGDVIEVFEDEVDERSAVISVIRRLNSWQKLLARSRPDGLTPEQQRGLFGELLLLRDILVPVIGMKKSIQAWTGPDDAAHDFHLGSSAIEAKSTIEIRPTHFRISSEHQLDDAEMASLFLVHNLLDTRTDPGMSLVEIVELIRQESEKASVRSLFEEKLITAGYLDSHRDRYAAPKYTGRDRAIYQVTSDFPRITPATLPEGVEQARYMLSITSAEAFLVDQKHFAESIEVPDDN